MQDPEIIMLLICLASQAVSHPWGHDHMVSGRGDNMPNFITGRLIAEPTDSPTVVICTRWLP